MKIGQTLQSMSSAVPRPQSGAEEKTGALVIIDSFESEESHGYHVEAAARELGPTGTLHRYNQLQKVGGRLSMPYVEALKAYTTALSQPLSREQAAKGLDSFISGAASGTLELGTSVLRDVTAEGFQNSVVNYSQGLDALTLFRLAKHPLGKGSQLSGAEKQAFVHNLAGALDLKVDENFSIQRLDTQLLQRIQQTLKWSPDVDEAKKGWRAQVQEFEAGHNSVVLAAGNSGQIFGALEAAGFPLDGSEDANIFAVPEVTVVSAVAATPDGGLTLAVPSSFGREVDFLASGEHGELLGTSFASPRVANTMRGIHAEHPELSSEEAEEMTKREFAQSGLVRGHQVAILNSQLASEYLQSQD